MHRQLEPELMEDPEQVLAYALADFAEPHNAFIGRLRAFVGEGFSGNALDLGCGSGDISRRFIREFPASTLDAVDGSLPMLEYAKAAAKPPEPINYILGRLPGVILPKSGYDIIFSNSLLHHLPDPQILWQTIKSYAKTGTHIAVMDLLRPESTGNAMIMVKNYAGNEPEILQHDFYHSLLAAFRMEEIALQLLEANLPFKVEKISDRHVFISGVMP
jgi:trans-aconitate methyltransferase